MHVAIVGLGTMGSSIARRISHEHTVFGFDPYAGEVDIGNATRLRSYDEVIEHAQTVLILVPAGDAVDDVIQSLSERASEQVTLIDGGNSNFHDSLARHEHVEDLGHVFLDVGISGGQYGEQYGYSVMAGGASQVYNSVEPILRSIAAEDGCARVGPAGAGHYVKMVHNGIEYALLQAYAEGFHILHNGRYPNLDLEQISRIWQHGAVVDSFLLGLVNNVMQKDQDFTHVSGYVAEGGTGRWTVEEALEQGIPVHTIAQSLSMRLDSQHSGGTYASKLIALLRHEFGGHAVKHTDES